MKKLFILLAASTAIIMAGCGSSNKGELVGVNDRPYFEDIDLKGNIEYINVPVMAKFYVTKGLSLNVGVQPGFMTKAKAKASGDLSFKDASGKRTTEMDFKSECNKVDFSIPMSIAYEFENGLTFEARYTTGLTNVGKDLFDSTSSSWDKAYQNKNEVFMLTVGYKFEL